MASILTPITDLDNLLTNWGTNGDHNPGAGVFASDEITINAVTKTFYFKAGGNLANGGSGVTGQALYSFFKDRWKNVPELPQYEFPMLSITNEQFEFINDWVPDDTQTVSQTSPAISTTTRKMIRTAGWAEVKADNSVGRRYSGIISLGDLGTTDQPYYVQDAAFTATTAVTTYTGPINEAVQIFGNTAVDATSPINTDLSGFFKVFVRTRGKTYADANLVDIGVSTMTYIVYRFPVTNANDLNINTTNDNAFTGATISNITGNGTTITVDTTAPHGLYAGAPVTISGTVGFNGDYVVDGITDADTFTIANSTTGTEAVGTAQLGFTDRIQVNYLENPDTLTGDVVIRGAWQSGITYNLGDVVFDTGNSRADANGARWYYVDATTGPSAGVNLAADTGNTWTLWAPGQRDIEENGTWSAYTTVIELNNNLGTPGATKEVAYEYAQWALRQTGNINNNSGASGVRNGEIADTLVFFVGSTLNTYSDSAIPFAIVLDDIAAADVNNIQYNDYAGTSHFAPIVVLVSINFNDNLSNDADAVFYAYYTSGEGAQAGNDYGTVNAIQVKESNDNNVGQTIQGGMGGAYDVPTTGTYEFNYAYDADVTNGRTGGTPVNITIVAIGLNTGQYVSTSGNITATGGQFSLVAPLERNYTNPV